MSSALTDDDGAQTLDFEQTLERLLGLVNREVEVAVRAQGATVLDEVMTARGRLLGADELPEWLRRKNRPLLEDQLEFVLTSNSCFWLCRADFVKATWWPWNEDVQAGPTLLVVLVGCELTIQQREG